jgi:ABC-type molybdate transport system substrate-binding protein
MLFASATFATAALAQSDPVSIFAAGSLRGVVADLSREAGENLGVRVEASFGGSGLMRERIEKGEKADLLLSADLGSPRKLESAHRTTLPVIAFARNRMCVVSRKSEGITTANLIDRLLAANTRVKTSTPVADPSGDYAWSIFDRIDAMRPGSGARLKEKAQAMMSVTAEPASPSQSAAAALFVARRIDLSITYCSASAALIQELPELSSLEVPATLDPHPVYGIAVLSDRPEVLRVVLFLLSEKGQAIIARNGLVPLVDSAPGRQ